MSSSDNGPRSPQRGTAEEEVTSDESGEEALTGPDILNKLFVATGTDFAISEAWYNQFTLNAHNATSQSDFFDRLTSLREELTRNAEVGTIRGVDSWADGTDEFRHVWKSWDSYLDKLYRLNLKDNRTPELPPRVLSIQEQAIKALRPANATWIDPRRGPSYVDDIIRTKLVVPFADGVVNVSDSVKQAAIDLGLGYYRRYHAKDSGYHAHHIYVLIPVPDPEDIEGPDVEIAFEVKVLTKLQDTLGELTHLLYEHKRTGRLRTEKKRKLAWDFESLDFNASYVGHNAQYLEASMVRLKLQLADLERD
ncbi:hypothetical protein [Clavibacter michiganensis]|nr:hypothetical protein [Clavibacter michiganensis]